MRRNDNVDGEVMILRRAFKCDEQTKEMLS